MMTAMVLVAAQASVPVPVETRRDPVALPEWPWRDRGYSLRCEVSDGTMRHSHFALDLADDNLQARISGDDRHGLDTNGFVLTASPPPSENGNVIIRSVAFDAGNLAYALVAQAFRDGALQSTSFIARHTSESGGLPNMHQVLGFCLPANNAEETAQ